MVTKAKAFPSPWFRPEDLPENGKAFKIASCEVEEVGQKKEEKYVLRFDREEKALILKSTTWDQIAAFVGADSDDWPGKFVVLYPTITTFGGKEVPCVRVRRPRTEAPKKAAKKPDAEPLTSQAPPATTSHSAAHDDMADDEIPY